MVRKIRWRVDQELTKRSIDPLFKENYYTYDREEFLIDADMEFFKIKKLLNKNPKVLREDPILSLDYLRIINLLKKKKMMETTSNHYDVEDSIQSVYLDADETQDQIDRRNKVRRNRKDKELLGEDGSVYDMVMDKRETLTLKEDTTDAQVKAAKKSEMKEAKKIIAQFDKMSAAYTTSNLEVKQAKTVTAGSLKEKSGKKRTKSLSAKLRLKEKKT